RLFESAVGLKHGRGDFLATTDPFGEAANEYHAGQTRNKRLHAKAADAYSEQHPTTESHAQTSKSGHSGWQALVNRQNRKNNSSKPQHAAYRKINPAGYDDDCQAGSQNAIRRYLPEHIAMRAPMKEGAIRIKD